MVTKIRTFEDREKEVFTEDAPFQTVAEYTEWFLWKKEVNLTEEAQQLDIHFRSFFYSEISMEVAIAEGRFNTVYDPTDLIIMGVDFYYDMEEHMEVDPYSFTLANMGGKHNAI